MILFSNFLSNSSAYRRGAPMMGNRSLESYRQQQERSKSKTFPQNKESLSSSRHSPRSSHRDMNKAKPNRSESGGPVQIAALDERNLKKAVHR